MIKGLNKKQVDESRKLYGDNIIHEAEPETFWDKFKGAFDDPMIKLLLAIAAIMAIFVILSVTTLNIFHSFYILYFCYQIIKRLCVAYAYHKEALEESIVRIN